MSTYTQHFMATSVKKIELLLPENVSAKNSNVKPKPPLGGFKNCNRQKNSNSHKQNLTSSSPKCFTQVFDGKRLFWEKDKEEVLEENKISKRRIQSAKPRLISEKGISSEREVNLETKIQKVRSKRPISAIVLGSKTPWNYSFSSSANLTSSENNLTAALQSKNEDVKGLEPCVFGYKAQAYVSGMQDSAADNLSKVKTHSGQSEMQEKTRTLSDNDNISLSELIDFEDKEDSNFEDDDSIPSTLRPLLPWATPAISQDIIGIDPSTCLIFLPSCSNIDSLPCVPPPQKPDEDLPYKEQIVPPQIHQKSKKYSHPWRPIPIEEYSCNHKTKRIQENSDAVLQSPRQIKVYDIDGILLHKSDCGQRTEKVVRKEIQELEDLMHGIGTLNGCSVLVQYQAEINILKNMLRRTRDRVEEIERREEERNKLSEPADHFGLCTFYKNHDEVMEQLRKQHALCVQELATLTEDLNMNTARCHFEKSLSAITSEEPNRKH